MPTMSTIPDLYKKKEEDQQKSLDFLAVCWALTVCMELLVHVCGMIGATARRKKEASIRVRAHERTGYYQYV